MTGKRIVGVVFIILATTSCGNQTSIKPSKPESDTTRVLQLLMDSGVYSHLIPDYSTLNKNNPFGDSIIFAKDWNKHSKDVYCFFPKNLKLKFITSAEICTLATSMNNDSIHFPGFLTINSFERKDSIYRILIQNTCVIPQYDKQGKPLLRWREPLDTFPCLFGMLCGGGVDMMFTKHKDSFDVKIEGSWSD